MTFSRYSLLLLSLLLVGQLQAAAEQEEQLGDGMVNPGHHSQPAWFHQSFLDISEDVAEAADGGKRILLYMYQDGCPYCGKMMQDNFGNRDVSAIALKHFNVIAINMWGDREVTGLDGEVTTEKGFARSLGVQFTPTLIYLDEKGKVVLRLNGYYPPHQFMATLKYVGNKLESKEPFKDYYARSNPVAASGKLHLESGFRSAPFDLKPANKPLLVMFEQKQCAACDELHQDILKRPEVRKSFDQFDVALVDLWSKEPVVTPSGEKLKCNEWITKLGVQHAPTMVFFDQQGKEVFRTNAFLQAFHTHAVFDYVLTGAYKTQPEFQRFIQARADALEAKGIHVDLMK